MSVPPWDEEVLTGFGAYAATMGIVDGDACGFLMEYDEDDEVAPGLVRTKMLELAPEDYQAVAMYGQPRPYSVALADDGEIYQYVPGVDGLGFFKKLFKKVKKGVKKVARKVKKVAKKVISKLPGGKYLIKLHKKLHKIAMKLVYLGLVFGIVLRVMQRTEMNLTVCVRGGNLMSRELAEMVGLKSTVMRVFQILGYAKVIQVAQSLLTGNSSV